MTKLIKDYANAAMRTAVEDAMTRGLVGSSATAFMYGFMCGAFGVTELCKGLGSEEHEMFNIGWDHGGVFANVRANLTVTTNQEIHDAMKNAGTV